MEQNFRTPTDLKILVLRGRQKPGGDNEQNFRTPTDFKILVLRGRQKPGGDNEQEGVTGTRIGWR